MSRVDKRSKWAKLIVLLAVIAMAVASVIYAAIYPEATYRPVKVIDLDSLNNQIKQAK